MVGTLKGSNSSAFSTSMGMQTRPVLGCTTKGLFSKWFNCEEKRERGGGRDEKQKTSSFYNPKTNLLADVHIKTRVRVLQNDLLGAQAERLVVLWREVAFAHKRSAFAVQKANDTTQHTFSLPRMLTSFCQRSAEDMLGDASQTSCMACGGVRESEEQILGLPQILHTLMRSSTRGSPMMARSLSWASLVLRRSCMSGARMKESKYSWAMRSARSVAG